MAGAQVLRCSVQAWPEPSGWEAEIWPHISFATQKRDCEHRIQPPPLTASSLIYGLRAVVSVSVVDP